MNKAILDFEARHIRNPVVHIQMNKSYVDDLGYSPEKLVSQFKVWVKGVVNCVSRDDMAKSVDATGVEQSYPVFSKDEEIFKVACANLEMVQNPDGTDNDEMSHYHIVLFFDPALMDRIYQLPYMKYRTKGSYLATCLKNILKKLLVQSEVNGISVTNVEPKKLSIIDYITKKGTENFVIVGDLTGYNPQYIPPPIDDFYRKNKGTGGIRSMFPSKPGPKKEDMSDNLLRKRNVDDDDAEKRERVKRIVADSVAHYVALKSVPSQIDFYLYYYDTYTSYKFDKGLFDIVKQKVVNEIKATQLKNPEITLVGALDEYSDKWMDFCRSYKNMPANSEERARITRYFGVASTFLDSPQVKEVYKWIVKYFMVDNIKRFGQKNRALIIKGNTNAGKTAFCKQIFRQDVFSTTAISLGNKYATSGMYNYNCSLWMFPDINNYVNESSLLRFQNIINGEECLREINQADSHNLYPSRPIVCTTTSDIVTLFGSKLVGRDDLRDTVTQFADRITEVVPPSPVPYAVGGENYPRSWWLEFLVYYQMYDVPDWMPFYLFWTDFLKCRAAIIASFEVVDKDVFVDFNKQEDILFERIANRFFADMDICRDTRASNEFEEVQNDLLDVTFNLRENDHESDDDSSFGRKRKMEEGDELLIRE